jgi:hypothetical protein
VGPAQIRWSSCGAGGPRGPGRCAPAPPQPAGIHRSLRSLCLTSPRERATSQASTSRSGPSPPPRDTRWRCDGTVLLVGASQRGGLHLVLRASSVCAPVLCRWRALGASELDFACADAFLFSKTISSGGQNSQRGRLPGSRGGVQCSCSDEPRGLHKPQQDRVDSICGAPAPTCARNPTPSNRGTSVRLVLVADGWYWFVLREGYCWLVAGGWFVVRKKYCRLVADKPSEQGVDLYY